MKKHYKVLATASALALVVASPNMAITSHAFGFDIDAKEDTSGDGYMPDDYQWHYDEGNSASNSGSSSSSSSYDGGSSDSGSSNSSSRDSGSSSGSGYSDGGSGSSESGYNGGSGDSGSGNAAAPAPTGLARKGNTVTIPGSETFRQVNKAADGRVTIYHCGIEQYTAQLKDADGNAAAYKSCGMYLDEASGKWYLNIVTEQDAAGYTVGTYKGSASYLPKLGVSGVMINNVLAVDAAEVAAAATK